MARFTVLLILAMLVGRAEAQELRSDSPLWTYDSRRDTGLFPESLFDDESFECSIPIRTGLYRRTAAEDADETFVRVDNYGVVHCALIYGEAFRREEASEAFEDHAWLIALGKVRRAGGAEFDLFALQIGMRAGSRYILLGRQTSQLGGPLEELDWRCPATAERRTARIDIWTQDACVLSAKTELRGIARAAARRPALAIWEVLEPDGESVGPPPSLSKP